MERSGGHQQQPASSSKSSMFAVYQNPALSAALTSNSLRPSTSNLVFILALSSVSALALAISLYRESAIANYFGLGFVSQDVARLCSKVITAVASIMLLGTLLALIKLISQWRTRNATDVVVVSPMKGTREVTHLTNRQLGLLGLRSKLETSSEETPKKPPKSRMSSPSPSNLLVPLHPSITGSNSNQGYGLSSGKSSTSGGNKMHTFNSPSKLPSSPSMYLVPTSSTRSPVPSPFGKTSSGRDKLASSPWSNKRSSFQREIATEEDLELFLADVDEKISESASKLATPPPSINAFGVASPNTVGSSINTSGATRSTPLRPVRMSPASQKFTTPPKKGEGDLPPPMSMEESIEAFERLGVYPHIEKWRDSLRQWFSAVVLDPLLGKIDTSHLKTMQYFSTALEYNGMAHWQLPCNIRVDVFFPWNNRFYEVTEAAGKLNLQITISQVGSDTPSTPATANASPNERSNDWKPAFTVDEDGLLHQLRATLVQFLDASKLQTSNFQQSPQHAASVSVLQEGVDAIMEHQRLHSLMKGEWGKGLLPQSSVRADYTVQRIRKLAEGTCLKNYKYLGNGEVFNKKWSLELPSDSHLLLYLFCAILEYPKWMLHVDPTTYAGEQASKNPLFLGVLPPKERFPEKYIAVISGVPSVLHPGACILAVGKQTPPVFALYWDKKPQFSFQGRTALWDSILLLSYKIKISYGGIVRGMHLGSSALAILPVLEQETES